MLFLCAKMKGEIDMYSKSEMRKLSNEELNLIAQYKNSKGVATKEAKNAQELIWERRFYVREHIVDSYTGAVDVYDEDFQEYLDIVYFGDAFR